MSDEEKYFLASSLLVAVFLGFLMGQHAKKDGFSFGKSFFYTTVGVFGLACAFWQWYWK
jgi:hypothetical protein